MKKLILILVPLLLLLIGGGAAGWWFFLKNPEMEIADLAEMARPGEQPPIFEEFEPMVLPVIRDGTVIQHLTFTIILVIDPESENTEIYMHRRQLTDAFMAQLHALYSHRLVQQRDNVEPLIAKRLLAVSRRLLGSETMVNQVLVNVLDRRDLIRG